MTDGNIIDYLKGKIYKGCFDNETIDYSSIDFLLKPCKCGGILKSEFQGDVEKSIFWVGNKPITNYYVGVFKCKCSKCKKCFEFSYITKPKDTMMCELKKIVDGLSEMKLINKKQVLK